MWDFELVIQSAEALIPMDFVVDYVLDLKGYVERGFTAVFEERMVGRLGGVEGAVVGVGFRVVRELGRDYVT